MTDTNGSITWVLTAEPTPQVERAIEIVESRLASEGEIAWVAPIIDPVQD